MFSAETVVLPVTVQVDEPSTFTLIGCALAEPETAEALSVMFAVPVHVLPSSRLSVTDEIVSALTVPLSVWLRPVKTTVAPFDPALPQLFESLPAAVMSAAASESKSSVVLLSTTFALVLVK